jgi:hypothetical protein
MLVTVMANVAYGGTGNAGAVALILQALKLDILYGVKVLTNSAGFQILLALSINLTGFGCAGNPETVSRLSTSHAAAGEFLAQNSRDSKRRSHVGYVQFRYVWPAVVVGLSSTTTSSGDTRRDGKHMPT